MLFLILSIACAGLFCGAALYVNFVEPSESCFAGRPCVESVLRVRFARHPPTIQKLIRPSRRANAFRNLPDGEQTPFFG
jgi:hypothetical protein